MEITVPEKLKTLKKQSQLITKMNQKVARTRRQRGYNWEDTLVKRFNARDTWKAFRLGSPSVALPDILVVNTNESIIYVIEAKSGTSTTLRVPYDQIIRCLKWIDTFELYQTRKMVIAFKFMSKKRIGKGEYEHRELKEYYKIWDKSRSPIDFVCTYNGETYTISEGKRETIVLDDCLMPFSKNQK